ncbi:sigma-70 family RNA polymerase sigma factor [Hyphococcus sp.]|uniref:sigma-70 family RNA polymerase sigma factor n=1 Tax=Hyphococcus sp. TaxID=2038636 RepID=UPI00208AA6D3|nr:MAG: RNA polymerase sigma factor [Marinicaulis sp.]
MASSEEQLNDLMSRSLSGDAHAHEAMLRLLAPALRSFFGWRIRDAAQDVDDLVQEALIAIHTRRMTFDPSRPLLPWVYAIARYKLVDYFRRQGATPPLAELEDTSAVTEFESACAAQMDIATLLDHLPEKQRFAIRATRIEGESISDVAAERGWSESDVKISVHRGLKALANRFGGAKA